MMRKKLFKMIRIAWMKSRLPRPQEYESSRRKEHYENWNESYLRKYT
jgi:hypothetical protein